MADTRPTADQIMIHSSKTGDSVLDDYIENAEQGNVSIGDMLAQIFEGGIIRVDLFQFREDPDTPGQIQFRVGDFVDPDDNWVDIEGDSFPDVLAAAKAAASAAASSASDAALSAAKLIGTSTTAVSIGTGSKSFTTQTGKFFGVGQSLLVTSDASPAARRMTGVVTAYSGTSLTINVLGIAGSGSYSDWTIRVSGEKGEAGAPGAPGAGTGDMLTTNNLSDLTSAAIARANLGLGTAATTDLIDEDSFATNSASRPPSQQSTKAYVDNNITNNLRPFYDEDDMASDDEDGVPSQQSTKAYVDNQIAALSGRQKVSTTTISGSPSVIDISFVAGYDYYIKLDDIGPATDGQNLLFRFKSGATVVNSSNYRYNNTQTYDSSATGYSNSGPTSSVIIANPTGSGVARSVRGELVLFNPANASRVGYPCGMTKTHTTRSTADEGMTFNGAFDYHVAGSSFDGCAIFWSGGIFRNQGRITVYREPI